jgi:hypothetical protein
MNAASHVSVLFIELGAVVVGLAILARLASRWGFSTIPLYLIAGLGFGNGGLLPLDGLPHLLRAAHPSRLPRAASQACPVRGDRNRVARVLGLLGLGIWFGYFRTNPVQAYVPFLAFGNVVALMHFWYDGFIWSVRRGQV